MVYIYQEALGNYKSINNNYNPLCSKTTHILYNFYKGKTIKPQNHIVDLLEGFNLKLNKNILHIFSVYIHIDEYSKLSQLYKQTLISGINKAEMSLLRTL